jgi:S-adenosylmethionine:tRNA ribosyltransferase-isomerase
VDPIAANLDDRLDAYAFDLPPSHIATTPLPKRSSSRLLVLPRDEGAPLHRRFQDVIELLTSDDLLVVNDTTVIPARLYGEKAATGGAVEVLLVRPEPDGTWIVLLSSSKKPKVGARILFGMNGGARGGAQGSTPLEPFFGTVLGRIDDEPGAWRMGFEGDVARFAQAAGHVPLPPYIEGARDASEQHPEDRERYQTVYADPTKPGSSAAPTAGLHFDPELLAALQENGVSLARVTLHVGPGTFLPVRDPDLSTHKMHAEPWELPQATADAIARTRARGGRVIAVGTTSCRVLESAAASPQGLVAGSGLTRIFIRPGHRFRAVDALITNFHLPESTLLVLVSAMVGRQRILAAYEEAIREGYRFYSYGDACFLEVSSTARATISP